VLERVRLDGVRVGLEGRGRDPLEVFVDGFAVFPRDL